MFRYRSKCLVMCLRLLRWTMKKPWLFRVYRASKTTQLYRDHVIHHEIRIPFLNNQDDSMEAVSGRFVF